MTATEPSGREILWRTVLRLDSADPLQFLAQLLWALNLEIRGTYLMPPDSPERAAVLDLVCRNEFLHVIQSQIRAEVGRGLGYPDAALLEELRSRTHWGDDGCQHALDGALTYALAVTAPTGNGASVLPIFERAAERLTSPARLSFLLHLARHVSDQLRSSAKIGPGSTEIVKRRFACLAELAVRTCDRMLALVAGQEPATDSDAFLTDMVAAANEGRCGGALRGVLESTLNALSGTSRVG